MPPLPAIGYTFVNAWVQGTVDVQWVTLSGLDTLLDLDLMRPVDRHSLHFAVRLKRLRVTAAMRVRLSPGTALRPRDSDASDSNESDSDASSHTARTGGGWSGQRSR